MEETNYLLSAYYLLDHVDYIHSFKHLKGQFQIRKFDLEWHHLSAFWMNYFLFFLICIHIFPTGHSFQQCSLADHKLLTTCILISTCCFTYKHIIYLLQWYFQQPPCLWASFILTDPQILIRHLDLPASFHERLRPTWLGSPFTILVPVHVKPSFSTMKAPPSTCCFRTS